MMWEDPIVEEVRKNREEMFKEFGCSLDALFDHFKKTQAERVSTGGGYVSPSDTAMKVAEEPPKYETGND